MDSLVEIARWVARALRRLARVVAVSAMVATTGALALVALLPALDARAMVVTSGSMEPTLPVGSLLLVHDVDTADIGVDDVITYRGYTVETLTTHRVIERRTVQDRVHFRTRGDANDAPDPDLAPAEGVVGRVELAVPHAGRALGELQRPAAQLLLLGVPSLALCVGHAVNLRRSIRERRGSGRGRVAPVTAVLLVASLVATDLWGPHSRTAARFVDRTSVGQNTFETGTW